MGTDFGHCCQIVPQIALNPIEELAGLKKGDDGVRPGSKTGETNGLAVLLDAENYNIGYYKSATQGVKVAVHDHRLDMQQCGFASFLPKELHMRTGQFIVNFSNAITGRNQSWT